MISDANSMAEEQLLFSRPQVLQQLRDQLLSLIRQDNYNLEELLQLFDIDILPLFNTTEQMQQQNMPKIMDYLNSLLQQSKERSTNTVTLANLAIKMIDYIRQKEENYQQIRGNYEHQMDSLKSTIDFLTNKNDIIENDVQIFKTQLQAAQNQLQQIVGEREQENEDNLFRINISQMATQKQKDWKIENLEAELERIREQLHFFKFNSKSRKSQLQLVQNSSADEKPREQQYIQHFQIVNRVTLEEELYKSSQLILWLQQQNQLLKRQIMELSQFKSQKQHNFHTILSDHEAKDDQLAYRQPLIDINDQADQVPVQIQQNERLLIRATHFNIFQRISSLRKLSQNNSCCQLQQSPQKKQNIEVDKPENNFCYMSNDNNFHALNSDWSSKSFQLNVNNLAYQNLNSAKQTFVRQEDEDEVNKKTVNIVSQQITQFKVIQQTRQTENSVKQFQYQISRLKKKFCNMGVNTMNSSEQNMLMAWKDAVVDKLTSNYIYKKLEDYVVRKRIKRNEKKAKLIINTYIS